MNELSTWLYRHLSYIPFSFLLLIIEAYITRVCDPNGIWANRTNYDDCLPFLPTHDEVRKISSKCIRLFPRFHLSMIIFQFWFNRQTLIFQTLKFRVPLEFKQLFYLLNNSRFPFWVLILDPLLFNIFHTFLNSLLQNICTLFEPFGHRSKHIKWGNNIFQASLIHFLISFTITQSTSSVCLLLLSYLMHWLESVSSCFVSVNRRLFKSKESSLSPSFLLWLFFLSSDLPWIQSSKWGSGSFTVKQRNSWGY